MNRILIVDPQTLACELLEAALNAAAFTTIKAKSRPEALSALNDQPPDLMVLDIALPHRDGLELLKAVRADPSRRLPVIILTELTDKATVLAAAKLGIQGFIHKSKFSLSMLIDAINKCLATAHDANSPASAASSSINNTDETNGSSSKQCPSAPNTGRSQIGDLRDLKPIITRSNLLAKLDDCGELKGFSPAIAEVLKLTASDRCSIEQVAKAISRDHGMALKILKLANSAVYTRGEPVDAVHKAVLRIGVGQIRQAVLNLAVIDQYCTLQEESIDGGQFWEHAIATGIVAAEIARSHDEKHADGAFTMGLLHDVGRMVLLDRLGDVYKNVLQISREWELPLEQVEHRMLCFNHAEAMDKVFRKWNFPKEFIHPIVFHHLSASSIRQAAPQEVVPVATLALANRLVHALMLGTSGNQTIYPTEEHCEMLRLDPSVIIRIEQIARDETDKMKFALLVHSNRSNWTPLRDTYRKSVPTPIRPLYASASPTIDAYRIFVDQLTEDVQDGPPNIGIIHLRNLRDRILVSEQYAAMETAQAVQPLPLIIISPTGKLMPESKILESRPVQALSSPTTVKRFLDAIVSAIGLPMAKAASFILQGASMLACVE